MKAIDPYFPVILFIMLYKVVLTFESVDEIPQCEQYFFLWYCLLYMLYNVVVTFES